VATIRIHDQADQFRIEIAGRFAGDVVSEVDSSWKAVLNKPSSRRLTVDISRMSGYDTSGRKVLAEMYHHGTHIAASTPSSLVFLNEISAPIRRGRTLLHRLTQADLEAKPANGTQTVVGARAVGYGK
jgi:hypothetical protein